MEKGLEISQTNQFKSKKSKRLIKLARLGLQLGTFTKRAVSGKDKLVFTTWMLRTIVIGDNFNPSRVIV